MYGSLEGRWRSHTVFVLCALMVLACGDEPPPPGAQPEVTKVLDAGRGDSGNSDGKHDTNVSTTANSEETSDSDDGGSPSLPSTGASGGDTTETTSTDVTGPGDSDSQKTDAGPAPTTNTELSTEVDSGSVRPVMPSTLDPLPSRPIVLNEQALSSCVLSPLPSDAEAQPECDVCSEDLRACPVVTGVAEIDSYYRAVSALARDADRMQVLQEYLIEQALTNLGRETGPTTQDDVAFLNAALAGGLDGRVEGSLRIEYAQPSCVTSVETLLPFALECDPAIDPGWEMRCAGTCNAGAAQDLTCDAFSELTCRNSGSECPGSCVGECQAQTGVCTGECIGECELDGSVECPGECQGELNGNNCTGACVVRGATCPGVCTGSCRLLAPGMCDGVCLGECSFTPPSGGCGADEQTLCSASAEGEEPCRGTCDGGLSTRTKAECETTGETFSALAAECVVPGSWVRYELTADARASYSEEEEHEFDGRLDCLGQLMVSAATLGVRTESLIRANQRLISARPMWDAVFEIVLADDPTNAQLTCGSERLQTSSVVLEQIALQLSTLAETSAELNSLFL
jgi:hypothetical protein